MHVLTLEPNSTVYEMYLQLLEEEDPSLTLENPVHRIYIELRALEYTKKEAESALMKVGHWASLDVHIDHIAALRVSIAAAAGNGDGNGVGHGSQGDGSGRGNSSQGSNGFWDGSMSSRVRPEHDGGDATSSDVRSGSSSIGVQVEPVALQQMAAAMITDLEVFGMESPAAGSL